MTVTSPRVRSATVAPQRRLEEGDVRNSVFNAVIAITGGFMLAAVLFIPFAVIQYRRRGRMSAGRTLTWVAGIVYFLAIWTYTLLPFPAPQTMKCAGHNTRIGRFLDDMRRYPHRPLTALAHNPAFLHLAFNIALFLPLGFVLRLLWRRGVVVTTLVGFALSLFVETTQLTGVWGLYGCAYRVFDVDDMLSNTAGAFIGGVLSWPLARLVNFDDPGASTAPIRVTGGRRLLGAVCDVIFTFFTGVAAGVATRLIIQHGLLRQPYETMPQWPGTVAQAAAPFVIGLLFTLVSGRTPGDLAVNLSYVPYDAVRKPGAGSLFLLYLSGIGLYQLIVGAAAPLGLAYLLVSAVLIIATSDHRGLPGIVARLTPIVGSSR